MSLPPLVVVSIASWRLRNPTVRACRAVTVSIRCGSERPNRSSFPTTRVSLGREEGDRFGQSDAFVLDTAGDVGEELPAAGFLERILLEIEVLIVGRDPRVADEHAALV